MRVCLIILVLAGSAFGQPIQYTYDKFKDYATYYSSRRPLKALAGQARPFLDVSITLDVPAATGKQCTVGRVDQFECSFWLVFRSKSRSLRFLRHRAVTILADGQRISLNEALHSSDVRRVGKSVFVVEWMKDLITMEQLRLLAKARTVEFQVGTVEGAADTMTIRAFKDMLALVEKNS